MEEDNDQNHDGNYHGHCQCVHTHAIRKFIVHHLDVLREPVGDPSERRGIEERYRCAKNASHCPLKHCSPGVCAACGHIGRETKHEENNTAFQTSIDANVLASRQTRVLVGRPVGEPQTGPNVREVDHRQQEDHHDSIEGASRDFDVCLLHIPPDRSCGLSLLLH